MPSDETQFLHELETEVEAELDEARSSHPEKELGASPTEWLFDPTDVQREEVGLRSLLAGIEALERDIASRGAFYPSRDADRRKDIRSSTANGAPMAHSIGDSLRPLRELPHQTEQIDSLDHVAEHVAKAVKRAVPDGSPGNEVLSGADLGHPLHPPLTDVVIGAWTSALALDWLGGKRSGPAADRLVALGVLSAIPTAAAGLNDWATLRGPSRRLGLVHETTNVIATGLFGASWLARKVGHRLFGRLLALVGYGTVSLGAFLGRHLSFRRGVGVDHTALLEAPEDWTPVADEASVKELQPLLAKAGRGRDCACPRGRIVVRASRAMCSSRRSAPRGRGRGWVCRLPLALESLPPLRRRSHERPTAHPQPAAEVRVHDSKVEVWRLVDR
jgi:uncharacterized membrane protein